MKNILKNAKFGDKFLTKDGRLAIFWFKQNTEQIIFIVNKKVIVLHNNVPLSNQEEDYIVSRYREPIEEDKLDELADEYAECESTQNNYAAFIAGYRKAME